MTYNKVIHGKQEKKQIPIEEKKYEVEQLESLLKSSGWGLIVEGLKKRKQEQLEKLIKQRPSGVTNDEKIQGYDFMIRVNDIILELDNLIDMPNVLIDEYSDGNFTGGVNK